MNKGSVSNKWDTHLLWAAIILLPILLIISLCAGTTWINPLRLLTLFTGEQTTQINFQILHFVRLPRSLAALVAGASLSLAGAVLQTVLNNPMCSPNIIGVNAGAGFFMILFTALFPAYIAFVPAVSFLGAMAATFIVYLIALKTGSSKLAVILSGVAITGLLSALTDVVITLFPDIKTLRVDFIIGSFSGVTMANVGFALPYFLIGIAVLSILRKELSVLSLGDETALSLGLRVGLIRGIFLAAAAMLAGCAISLGGLVGFAGLIIPHIVRMITGYRGKYMLALSALLGSGFVLLCDTLARTIFAPYELPVGIILSLVGSPFFIYLILNRKGSRFSDTSQ